MFGFRYMVPVQDLHGKLKPGVEALGYELLSVEFVTAGRNATLRLYIDRSEGVCVEDCEKVSRYVSGVLDVEEPVPGNYSLEVSSPGPARPLSTADHFVRFIGRRVYLRLHGADDQGRRNFRGELVNFCDGRIHLLIDGAEVVVALAAVKKASLIPDVDG